MGISKPSSVANKKNAKTGTNSCHASIGPTMGGHNLDNPSSPLFLRIIANRDKSFLFLSSTEQVRF